MNLERLLKAARELEQALYNAENRFDSNSTTQKADIHHLRPSNITSPESWEIRFQNDPQNPIKTIAESKPWFPIIRQQPEASQSHSLPRPNSPAKYRMSIAGENKVATTRPKLPDDVSAEQRLRAMERVLRAQEHSLVDCFTFEKSDKLMSLLQR
jgi:hypothetical protein